MSPTDLRTTSRSSTSAPQSTATTATLVPSKTKGHHSDDMAVFIAAGVGAAVILVVIGAYIKFCRGRGAERKGVFANPLYVSSGEDFDPDKDDTLLNIGGFDNTIAMTYEDEGPSL